MPISNRPGPEQTVLYDWNISKGAQEKQTLKCLVTAGILERKKKIPVSDQRLNDILRFQTLPWSKLLNSTSSKRISRANEGFESAAEPDLADMRNGNSLDL